MECDSRCAHPLGRPALTFSVTRGGSDSRMTTWTSSIGAGTVWRPGVGVRSPRPEAKATAPMRRIAARPRAAATTKRFIRVERRGPLLVPDPALVPRPRDAELVHQAGEVEGLSRSVDLATAEPVDELHFDLDVLPGRRDRPHG